MTFSRRATAALALSAWIVLGASLQDPSGARRPVPDAGKQSEVEKSLRRLFEAEYDRKSPADRRSLALKFLESAPGEKDKPDLQYVLLKESRELALQAGDLETAFRAIEATVRGFEVEAGPLKLEALDTASKTARSRDESAVLAERYLGLVDEALAACDLDSANKAVKASGAHARRAGDAAQAARAAERAREITSLRSSFEKTRKAREILSKNPTDRAASLEYGRFLCLEQGAWDQGLPLLARGSDAELRAIAEKDLATSADTAEQTQTALAWLKLAEEETGDRQDRCYDRSVHWYGKALSGADGVLREVILGRLRNMPPSKRPIDLLSLVDPARDTVFGSWTAAEGGLVSDASQFARFEIPYHPPAEYELRVTFTRLEGNEQVVVFLAQGIRPFALAVSGEGADCCAWMTLRGLWNNPMNPTYTTAAGALVNGKPCTVAIEMRERRIQPILEGKPLKSFMPGASILELPEWLALRDPAAPGFGSYQSPTRVHRIEITELKGRGYRVR